MNLFFQIPHCLVRFLSRRAGLQQQRFSLG
jgi:hypothetical protein